MSLGRQCDRSIGDLPDDCLAVIYKKLESTSDIVAFGLTCRRWLQLQNSFNKLLKFGWLKTARSRDYVGYLPKLLRRFQHPEDISLLGCSKLPDHSLSELQHFGSGVTFLSLDCCFEITDNAVAIVSAGCPSLISLSLYRCNITDAGMKIIASSCKCLQYINITYCNYISDHGIKAISNHCSKLNALIFSSCKHVEGTGFSGCSSKLSYLEAYYSSLTREGITAAVSGGGLEYLNLSGLRFWKDGDGLDGIGSGLAQRLRFLNLRCCRFVGDGSVAAIATGCPLLEDWNLGLCHEVRIYGWQAIGASCQKLRVIHVNRCRNLCDTGLQFIRDGCRQLAVLHIQGCRNVSNLALETFSRLRSGVSLSEEECPSIAPTFNFINNQL